MPPKVPRQLPTNDLAKEELRSPNSSATISRASDEAIPRFGILEPVKKPSLQTAQRQDNDKPLLTIISTKTEKVPKIELPASPSAEAQNQTLWGPRSDSTHVVALKEKQIKNLEQRGRNDDDRPPNIPPKYHHHSSNVHRKGKLGGDICDGTSESRKKIAPKPVSILKKMSRKSTHTEDGDEMDSRDSDEENEESESSESKLETPEQSDASSISAPSSGSSVFSLGSTSALKRRKQLKRLRTVVAKAQKEYEKEVKKQMREKLVQQRKSRKAQKSDHPDLDESTEEDEEELSESDEPTPSASSTSTTLGSDSTSDYLKNTAESKHFMRRTRGNKGRNLISHLTEEDQYQKEDARAFQELCDMVKGPKEAKKQTDQKKSNRDSKATEASATSAQLHEAPFKLSRHEHHHHSRKMAWDEDTQTWVKTIATRRRLGPREPSSSRMFRYIYPQQFICCRSAQHIFISMVIAILLSFLIVPIVTLSLSYEQVMYGKDDMISECVLKPVRSAIYVSNVQQVIPLLTLFAVYGGVNMTTTVPLLVKSDATTATPAAFVTTAKNLNASAVNAAFIGGSHKSYNLTTLGLRTSPSFPELVNAVVNIGGAEGSISRIIDSLTATASTESTSSVSSILATLSATSASALDAATFSSTTTLIGTDSSSSSTTSQTERLTSETALYTWVRYLLNPTKFIGAVSDAGLTKNTVRLNDTTVTSRLHRILQSLEDRYPAVETLTRRVAESQPLSGSNGEDLRDILKFMFGDRAAEKERSKDPSMEYSSASKYSSRIQAWLYRHSTYILSLVSATPTRESIDRNIDVFGGNRRKGSYNEGGSKGRQFMPRAGELLRRLSNLASTRNAAIQQRQLLYSELLSTPNTSPDSDGFDFALSVLQPSTTASSSSNATVPTTTPDFFPLGTGASVLASTLENSFTRFYFDVVPVSRVNTSINGTYTLLPFIYTDDLFTTNGEIASTLQLPPLTTTSRNFPSTTGTNAPTSLSASFYGTLSNTSLKVANAFMSQLISEGPHGTLTLAFLTVYQREIVRGITTACLRGDHASYCTQSTLYREIVSISADLFAEAVTRAAMLLSKVGDGTVAEVEATNLDFSNASMPNADDNFMLMRTALGSTTKGDVCLPMSGAIRNLTEGSIAKSTVADLRASEIRAHGNSFGRGSCNPELWRRYGLINLDESSSQSATRKKGATLVIPIGNANGIIATGKASQAKLTRLLKLLALLRYDLKAVVAEERQVTIADDRTSIDAFLNANYSRNFVNLRPMSAQRRALAQALTSAWISKAIAFTKGLGIVLAQSTTYEVRVGSALAFGSQRRYNSEVGGDGVTISTAAQATVGGDDEGDAQATTTAAAASIASGSITRSSDSFAKLIDMAFSIGSATFEQATTFPSYPDTLSVDDSAVSASALLRNPGFDGSVVSLPLDGGNSVADSVAMLFNRAYEDAPWYDGNPLHRATQDGDADNNEDDYQGLMPVLLIARAALTEAFNNEMRKSAAILKAASQRGQSSSGSAVIVTYAKDNSYEGVSKTSSDFEAYAGISPITPKGEGSLRSLKDTVSNKAAVADSSADDAVVYVLWTSISPQIIVTVITVVFAGLVPLLLILWGLKGISLKLRYSHFPYQCLVLFFFAGILLVSVVIGGTIAGLGIRLIQTQGFTALEGGDRLATVSRLETFIHSPLTEQVTEVPNQLTSLTATPEQSYIDFLWDSELFHYFSSTQSSSESVQQKAFPKSLSSFLHTYFQVTLSPMLGAITSMTNESANAALLVGGMATTEEILTTVKSRIGRTPLKDSASFLSTTTTSTSNNASSISKRLNAPLIRSTSLVHALKATSATLNSRSGTHVTPSPSLGGYLSSVKDVLLSSPLFYSGSPNAQDQTLEKAQNRYTLVQQMSPFRSFQTLTCVAELEAFTEQSEANRTLNVLPRRGGCDVRSQQLLAAMVGNTRSLGSLIGYAIATTNTNGDIISTLSSAGGSLTSDAALASTTLADSAFAVLANSIPEILNTKARDRISQIVIDELETIYDDCKDVLVPLSSPTSSCDTTIEGVLGVCNGLLCMHGAPTRYVGYPNTLRNAVDIGALADAFRSEAEGPATTAFATAFTRQDTPSKGILSSPISSDPTAAIITPSSILDAVNLGEVTEELSRSAAYSQLMIHDKVTRMIILVNAVVDEALVHTTRFVIWITIIGIFLLQLLTYGLYRLIIFNAPDSRELL